MVSDIMSKTPKEVICPCYCCGKDVLAGKIGVFSMGEAGMIITCDKEICKTFAEINLLDTSRTTYDFK